MSDLASTITDLQKGGLIAAGATVLTILGAFLGPLLSGATRQEKDLRDGLAARIAKLEERVNKLEEENEEYRQQQIVEQKRYIHIFRDRERIRAERDVLRIEVNSLRADCSKTAHQWDPDPQDPTF